MNPPKVYLSDASWSASGNRSGTRYHFENPADAALAACGRFTLDNVGIFGQPAHGWDPADVPDFLRCRRAACANRYRAILEG